MRLPLAALCVCQFAFAPVAAQTPKTSDTAYVHAVKPLLEKHCLSCHTDAMKKPKGNLRLDKLAPDVVDAMSREVWMEIAKRVKSGEMPPESRPRMSAQETQTLLDWIGVRVQAADARRAAEGRVVLRRLNRIEYENTLSDLLGVPLQLREMLPQDASAGGFDNVGEALHVSPFLMEKYLEAAEKALNIAIANGPQPPIVKKRYTLKDSYQVRQTTEKVFRHIDGAIVCFSSSPWQAPSISSFYPPDRGSYRFRISSSGFQSAGKPVTFRIDAGGMSMTSKNHLVGYFDAPDGKEIITEFVDHLEPRSTIRLHPYGLASAQHVNKIGADNYEGPGLAVQWIDIEGPLNDTWPPESHRRIFGDLQQGPAPIYNFSKRVEVVSKNPEADAAVILRKFAQRAMRRNVTEDDLKPFLGLVKARLADKYTFEQAVRVGLMGILVSKDFLFLREQPGKLDDFALASRLSYFLWSTMPDNELFTLAEQNKLSQPAVLRAQVERMLKDAKARNFTENFVGQWLNLREIDATTPSHILYPEYDEMLKASMLRETYLFFEELLKNDLSLTNFVSSDFSMLNGRLAKHYGIPGVDGWEFRKVKLPADSHRGGVLTMASVLKVTANGTYTSPILRGAWVLERILGTPPPKPPDGVTAIEPDIRGATTVRQQLAKHRQLASCASCHVKIDPPGFALESFDVIGGWRDFYRTSGNGKAVMIDGRRMPYLQGPNVDAGDVLENGQAFKNIDEYRALLLKDKDQIARNLTERLVTYATGAATQPADQPEIDAILTRIRSQDFGLKTLLHEVVASRLFQSK